MPHAFRRLVVSAAILGLVACGDRSGELPVQPTRPSTAVLPPDRAALEAQILSLINALYAPTAQGPVLTSFARIKASIASRRTDDAQAAIVAFFKSTLADLAGGTLQDPNGTQDPTLADAVRDLLNGVAEFGGLPAPIPPTNPFAGDGAVGVVGTSGGTLVSSSGFGGVTFPAGALPADVIVVVSRLPNPTTTGSGPLPTTLNQYPLFYDFTTTPPVTQFAQPVTVGICQLEVGEQFGPPSQTVADRLQLAHPNPANPSTVELLQRVDANFIDCGGVSLASAQQHEEPHGFAARAFRLAANVGSRALSLFRPTPAYAVHGGLGGLTSSFSPFAAVDPGLMTVGVCSTAMAGVSATYPTITQALTNVGAGGVIKLCPQTITLTSTIFVTKPVTIEGSDPANRPQIIVPSTITGGANFNVGSGFVVQPTVQGSVTFRSLAFTLTTTPQALSVVAIDLGLGQGPNFQGSWWQATVEQNTFVMPAGLGRAVRAFQTVHANPKLTFRLNQVSGGGFPVVTLTGSSTSDIEILSNSFTGPFGIGVFLQGEGFARVLNNLFTSCGAGSMCVNLRNVGTGIVSANTFTIPSTSSTLAGIVAGGTGNTTITSNVILGGGLTGVASDSLSYRYRAGAIVISGSTASPTDPFNASATGNISAAISNNSMSNAAAAIRVMGGGVTATVANNISSNSFAALRLDNLTSTPSSLSVTTSDFTSYFTPFWFTWPPATPSTLTATCNWWGSVSGPTSVAVGTPASMFVPYATAPIASPNTGQCNGTNASASTDGVYSRASMIGSFTHTDRVVVLGRATTGHHEFTDGTTSGSWDWTGAIQATSATITGSGTRTDQCCGTSPFTLSSGNIQNVGGNAQLTYSATSAQFGAFGDTDFRLASGLSIGNVMTTAGVPANLGALTGTVNVSASIGPVAGTLSRIDLLVGTTVVATLPLNATNAPGAVWLRFNTASIPNGSYPMTAQVFTTQGGNTPAGTSGSLGITIAN